MMKITETSKKNYFTLMLTCVALCVPKTIWAILDHSVWHFDQAWYAESTLLLFRAQKVSLKHWASTMASVLSVKAPGMVWFGQFFIFLNKTLGSPEASMLLSIVFTWWLVFVFTAVVIKRVYPSVHDSIAYSTVLFVASMPLAVGLSNQYLVETSQVLVVAIFIYLCVEAPNQNPLLLILDMVVASSLAVLTKLTTPIYCVLPGLYLIIQLVQKCRKQSNFFKITFLHLYPRLMGLSVVTLPTYFWYKNNFRALWALSRDSAAGPMAKYYGHQLPFKEKLLIWLGLLKESIFSSATLGVVALLLVFACYAWIKKRFLNEQGKITGLNLLLISVGQIVMFLISASFQVNEDSRFVAALFPYAALIVAYLLYSVNIQAVTVVCGLVFLLQFLSFETITLDLDHSHTTLQKYVWPAERDRKKQQIVSNISHKICSEPNVNLIGVEADWFGPGNFGLYTVRDLNFDRRCTFLAMPLAGTDPHLTWKYINDSVTGYFVTLSDAEMDRTNEISPKPDNFNQVTREIAKLARDSRDFTEVESDFPAEVKVYKKIDSKISE